MKHEWKEYCHCREIITKISRRLKIHSDFNIKLVNNGKSFKEVRCWSPFCWEIFMYPPQKSLKIANYRSFLLYHKYVDSLLIGCFGLRSHNVMWSMFARRKNLINWELWYLVLGFLKLHSDTISTLALPWKCVGLGKYVRD